MVSSEALSLYLHHLWLLLRLFRSILVQFSFSYLLLDWIAPRPSTRPPVMAGSGGVSVIDV